MGISSELTERVIGLAIAVHRTLGPGLFEAVYETCLCRELSDAGIAYTNQVDIPLIYKGIRLSTAYRLDILIEDRLVIELKSVDRLAPIHNAQMLTYLRLGKFPLGLILNFNVPVLKDGIRRITL